MRKLGDEKSGQSVSIATIIAVALGVFVLVMVIYGFSVGWNKVFDNFGFLPDDLESSVQACTQYAQNSLPTSYCQLRELTLDGREGYYDCNFVRTTAVKLIGEDKIEFSGVSCASGREKTFCENLKRDGVNNFENVIVNEGLCSQYVR